MAYKSDPAGLERRDTLGGRFPARKQVHLRCPDLASQMPGDVFESAHPGAQKAGSHGRFEAFGSESGRERQQFVHRGHRAAFEIDQDRLGGLPRAGQLGVKSGAGDSAPLPSFQKGTATDEIALHAPSLHRCSANWVALRQRVDRGLVLLRAVVKAEQMLLEFEHGELFVQARILG